MGGQPISQIYRPLRPKIDKESSKIGPSKMEHLIGTNSREHAQIPTLSTNE